MDLTVEQVAEYLTVHVETVRRYIREGVLPANKVGTMWFVQMDELEKFSKTRSFKRGKAKRYKR